MRARSALCQTFEQAGFVLVRSNKHHLWRCPCGHTQIPSPKTPGKGRSVWNTEALMTRVLRACQQNVREAA